MSGPRHGMTHLTFWRDPPMMMWQLTMMRHNYLISVTASSITQKKLWIDSLKKKQNRKEEQRNCSNMISFGFVFGITHFSSKYSENHLIRHIFLWCLLQITDMFLNGHSNSLVRILGLKLTPILEHLYVLEPQRAPLRYSPLIWSTF